MTTLLGDLDLFFEKYWEEQFLHRAGAFTDAPVTLRDIDHLLADHVLTTTTVAMSAGGALLDEHRFTIDPTPLVTGGDGPQSVVDPDRLLAEFQRGATIVFQRAEDFLPAAAEIAAALTATTGHPARGNMFLTPPGSPGLPTHIDGADVFVVQCVGTKRWELWDRAVARPLCEDRWKAAELGEPDHVIDLHAGDLLYVPRGWEHRVGAGVDTSLSVSFNLRTVTRAHVARAAVERACAAESLRLALSPESMHDPEARVEEIRTVLADLADEIGRLDPAELGGVADSLVHQVRQPKPSVTLEEALSAIGLTDNHRLRLADDVAIIDSSLQRGSDHVTPPEPFLTALARAGSDPVTVAELRGSLPLEAAEPLLLRLLADGWVLAA